VRRLSPVDPGRAAPPDAAPVGTAEFDALMASLGPFEPAPHLAVGVSGGPDSLALTRLLESWVRARGGRLTAFTVDHGLRAEAADEAAWVGAQLVPCGIPHRTLVWRPAPTHDVAQAEARNVRYARLAEACVEAGILHLALAHHREDQAETLLLRIRGGTGPDGLSGMAWQRDLPDLRVIRPLLALPKARLKATLAALDQPWLQDPSNEDPSYERVRLRRAMPVLAADAGITGEALSDFAQAMGRVRRRMDAARNALAAEAVAVWPEGYATLTPAAILDSAPPLGADVLARTLRTIGGRDHLPRMPRLSRAMADLRADPGTARTLGGCRIVPWRGTWLIVREAGRVPRMAVAAGETRAYDGRFNVRVSGEAGAELWLAPLGEDAWSHLCAAAPSLRDVAIPPPVRPALPALWDEAGPREVPGVNWCRDGCVPLLCECAFAPRRGVGEAGFTVALA
jgi:tRNA(Ile)-lysidine synthase